MESSIDGERARPRALNLVVFVVGASSLGSEIAAARLLAPYFGASTVVWANTIATVLVALSIGYWWGGRLADRSASARGLSQLLLAASVGLAAIPFVARPFLSHAVEALDRISAGAAAGSLLAVLVLLSGPVLLLGAVAPYALRLALRRVEDSGTVSGRLYAVSTVGSLVGTFTAALLLIPFAGTQRTFLAFAIALAAVAALESRRLGAATVVVLGAVLAVPTGTLKPETADGRVIFEAETPYQYARVVERPDGRRRLELNEGLAVHSVYTPGRFLTGDYWDEFLVLPTVLTGRAPGRIAVLGNAAGTTARSFGHFFPSSRVVGVELDGRLTGVGRRLFDLRGRNLELVTADARPFLRTTAQHFDAIILDAYRQPYVPFYLATREFFELVRDRLAPGGVLMVNVGHPSGSEKLERVMTATIGSALGPVLRDPVTPTNTVLIASGAALDPVRGGVDRLPVGLAAAGGRALGRLGRGMRGGDVYTDDRAPVEWLIDGSILDYARDRG